MGILLFSEDDRAVIRPFLQGLEALGYVERTTFATDYRNAEASYERVLIVNGSRLVTRHRHKIGHFAAKKRLILVGVPKWLAQRG